MQETRIDRLERLIHAAAELIERPVEKVWEEWNSCLRTAGFDFNTGLKAFILAIAYLIFTEAEE